MDKILLRKLIFVYKYALKVQICDTSVDSFSIMLTLSIAI